MEQKKKKRNLFTLLFKNGKNSNASVSETKDEKIFGIALCDASDSGSILWGLQVPDPVYLCFEEICRKGLSTEGLFRLSGAASEVIALENQLDMCSSDERKIADMTQCDIHALTSLVKKYLRSLPDPVIPTSYHWQFLETESHDIESLGKIIMKLPFYNRQILQAILLMSSKIQDYVDFNMMSPEALATVFAPICTGFEKKIQTFHFIKQKSHQSPSKQDIEQHIATNKQWTKIWEEMIKERGFLIDMLHQQHFIEKETAPIWGHSHHYLNNNSRSLPSPFSATSTTPLPEEIIMAQFTPMETIEIVKPNHSRLKKTPNESHLSIKSDTIKRIFTIKKMRSMLLIVLLLATIFCKVYCIDQGDARKPLLFPASVRDRIRIRKGLPFSDPQINSSFPSN